MIHREFSPETRIAIQSGAIKSAQRPVYVDFDQYTDGDVEYRRELAALLIKNLAQVRDDLHTAIASHDSDVFFKSCHKAKVAIHMLNDTELNGVLAEITNEFRTDITAPRSFNGLVLGFDCLCDAIISTLEPFTRS